MDKTTKSFTLSQLITYLQGVKKECGNVEVVLSSDPEGNSFGTIDKDSFGYDQETNVVTIYPCEQFTDF